MMFHLGQDYAIYAVILRRKNQKLQAKENLGKAIQIFKECKADKWVEQCDKELAEL